MDSYVVLFTLYSVDRNCCAVESRSSLAPQKYCFSWRTCMHRSLFRFSSCPDLLIKKPRARPETYHHDFLVFGACRLNGKSLICLWHVWLCSDRAVSVVFFVPTYSLHPLLALLSSVLRSVFTARFFPFWESYFSISPYIPDYIANGIEWKKNC